MSRLEEIKNKYVNCPILEHLEGIDIIGMDSKDKNYLIQQAELREEQVQRNLQALENINVLEGIYDRLESENQRYERFLTKIKSTNTSKELYQLWARQALEGEE